MLAAAPLPHPALFIGSGPARAQDASGRATAGSACIDLRIGDERYYDCLNRLLRESVPSGGRTSAADAPYSAATTPSYAVGGFNQQATRQMLGNSFGTSIVPQRVPDAFGLPPLARAPR